MEGGITTQYLRWKGVGVVNPTQMLEAREVTNNITKDLIWPDKDLMDEYINTKSKFIKYLGDYRQKASKFIPDCTRSLTYSISPAWGIIFRAMNLNATLNVSRPYWIKTNRIFPKWRYILYILQNHEKTKKRLEPRKICHSSHACYP